MYGNVRFVHIPRSRTNNGITVAYRVRGDGRVEFAASQCALGDNYNHALGRAISFARLEAVAAQLRVESDRSIHSAVAAFFHSPEGAKVASKAVQMYTAVQMPNYVLVG